MRKKRISAILAMAVAGSMVLAGCGGSDFTLASETVTLELGETLSENAADYVVFGDNVSEEKQEEILAETTVDLSGVDQNAIGEYDAMVIYDGKNLSFTVQVQDTAAPAASLLNDIAEAHTGVEVAAADLVTDIVDVQDVTVQFVTSSAAPAEFEVPDAEAAEGEETAEGAEDAEAVEAEVPDESAQADGEDAEAENTDVADGESTDAAPVEGETSTTETVIGEEFADTYTFQDAGKYEITIRLTDASGNSTDLVQKVNVTDPDATAPVIEGVDDITVYLDNEPDYLDGVTASDDVDGDLTGSIVVDSSAVDVSTVGTYTATYSVKDAAGNETIETITVSVTRRPQAPATTTTTATPDAGTTPQASTDNGNSGGGSSSGGSSSGGSSSGGSSSGGGSSTPAPSNPAPTTPSTDGNNSGSVSSGDSGSTDSGSDSTWSEGEAVTGDNFADWATQNGADNSQSGDHANNTGDEIGFY